MKSFTLSVIFTLIFASLAYSQPLPSDSNTLALWNFNSDPEAFALDTSSNGVHGTAVNTKLDITSPIGMGRARYFKDHTSFMGFNPYSPGSAMDILQHQSWSIEFVVRLDRLSPDVRNVFNNGQVAVEIHDGRISATVNRFSSAYGVSSDLALSQNVNYRVAVVQSGDKLAIFVNGKVWASQVIPFQAKKVIAQRLPMLIGGSPREAISTVSLGSDHTCYIGASGDAYCFGNNLVGQSGRGQVGDTSNLPLIVKNGSNWTKLSTGRNFSCGVNSSKLYCWGKNDNLALGNLTQGISSLPSYVREAGDIAKITSGGSHSCAILTDKNVICWGRNDHGQLGFGFSNFGHVPSHINNFSDVEEISAGEAHTCAIVTGGSVYCWGKNDMGQVGLSPNGPVLSPALVNGVSGAVQISLGANHSCALLNTNEIKCWGQNNEGQLGNEVEGDTFEPVLVKGISPDVPTHLARGFGNHRCVQLSSKRVKCWGRNADSQLGYVGNFSRTAVDAGVTDVTQAHVSDQTTCFQKNSTLTCLGSNNLGNLGRGINDSSSTATDDNVMSFRQTFIRGWLDDIRVSKVARMLISRPEIQGLGFSEVSEEFPQLSMSILSAIPIDGSSLKVFLNGSPVSGLQVSGASITGTLSLPLREGVNRLEVSVSDEAGNYGKNLISLRFNPFDNAEIAKAVETSDINTCRLTHGGEVHCWGSNQFGQLGNTVNKFSSTPVKLNLKNIRQIALSHGTLCVLDREGNVHCLGSNEYGKLGTNSHDIPSRSYPVRIDFSKSVTKLFSHETSFCALHDDNSVSCWGVNFDGQFGNASAVIWSPQEIMSDVRTMSVGSHHSCYVKSNNDLWCRGRNIDGELGNNSTSNTNQLQYVMSDVEVVSAGVFGTCALKFSGQVYCWGVNHGNQIQATPVERFLTPQEITHAAGAVEIGLGDGFACAKMPSGSLRCWGAFRRSETGNGNSSGGTVDHSFNVVSFSNRAGTTCLLDASGDTFCWGSNSIGQAGSPEPGPVAYPTKVESHITIPPIIMDLVAGETNTCMKKGANTFCWGATNQGQFGQTMSTRLHETYPQKITFPGTIVQTSVGYAHICHLDSFRKVWCAGRNDLGQIGNSNFSTNETTYKLVLSNADEVHAGEATTCARSVDKVYCWGSNTRGQLGINSSIYNIRYPMQVNISGVSRIFMSTRGLHVCAQKSDGSVWCWGENTNNQISTGPTNFITPYEVRDFKDATKLALGKYTTCILRPSGKAACGVVNTAGQAGIGTSSPNFGYRNVAISKPISDIKSGAQHICATDIDKNLYCWGDGSSGQVGFGELSDRVSSPRKVLSDVRDFTLGGDHTCAITESNKLACWGFNGNAQLGIGSFTNSPSPVFSDVTKRDL